MRGPFYRLLMTLSRRFGPWIFEVGARAVAAAYFALFPGRTATSASFYRVLFPDRGRLFHWRCAWRQFQNFTSVYLDRFLMREYGAVSHRFDGWDRLEAALASGKGAIVLMSHQGNWEVAAELMTTQGHHLEMMLYIGIREKEAIERMHKSDMEAIGLRLVAVPPEGGSPFDLLDGLRFIESGGLVAMTGDRTWRSDQRRVPVRFLGHRVMLPETPYLFALLSRTPIFVFFSHREAARRYRFTVAGPLMPEYRSRRERDREIRKMAQQYADLLEAEVRRHPFEWYHFQPFLGEPLPPAAA